MAVRRQKIKIIAEVIPSAWIASAKSRAPSGGMPTQSTRKGKETAPPPIGVDPATSDPSTITSATCHWRITSGSIPTTNISTAQIMRNTVTYAYQNFMSGACVLVLYSRRTDAEGGSPNFGLLITETECNKRDYQAGTPD